MEAAPWPKNQTASSFSRERNGETKFNQKYNALSEYQQEERKEILRELLGELNEAYASV